MGKVIKHIDDMDFELKEDYDFDWLKTFGRVFKVFDQQDSGNICFGVENEIKKFFIKYAGAPTVNYEGKYEDTILRLKNSVQIYESINHKNLIKLIDHFEVGSGYALIYEWVDGECLHAHWDFDKYPKYTHPQSPNYKFNQLSLEQKLNCVDNIFDLHQLIAEKGYVAVDFYDGSIIYNFETNETMICDIDFYTKGPFVNSLGRLWGSRRFMSPEEFEMGAMIDEVTNVFTMGAVAFEVLGDNQSRSIEQWKASKSLFEVAKKATSNNRSHRYQSIRDFYSAWKRALSD